jgi:hypothetical protein
MKLGPKAKLNTPLTSLLKESMADVKNGRRTRSTVPVDLPPGARLDRKTGEFKLPATAAAKADLLYATKQLRYEVQHRVETLQKLQTTIENWFIENLPKSEASGIAGRTARVQIETKPVPQCEDWTAFYAYVKKNDAFELLQRRLSDGAIKERLEEGSVPGITIFQAKKVSATKI